MASMKIKATTGQDTNRNKRGLLVVSQGCRVLLLLDFLFFNRDSYMIFCFLLSNIVPAVGICTSHHTEASLSGPLAQQTIAGPLQGPKRWGELDSADHTVWIHRWFMSGLLESPGLFTGMKVGVSTERK